MKKFIYDKISIIVSLVIILLWQLLGVLNLLPKFILPTPFEIVKAFISEMPVLATNSLITLTEAFIGLGVGITLAFILAITMDMFEIVHRALYPMLVVTQTIPTVAIAPILVLWLGFGILPKIILVVLTTLFPIVIGILNGFAHCDKDAIQLLKLMSASKLDILYHVKLPTSLGYFFSGLRISVSYAFIGAVVAEWLGGFEGLGVYMIRVKNAFSYDKMFAVIVLISMLSLFFMNLVKILEKKVIKWEKIGEEN